MENQISNTKVRAADSVISELGLAYLIKNMKKSRTWIKGELNSLILINKPEKQVILAAIHEGTEIESFQSNDSISVQVIEGRIKFNARKNISTIRKGQLMKLDENIKYSFIAGEDTVFLLTISNNIGINSVYQRN